MLRNFFCISWLLCLMSCCHMGQSSSTEEPSERIDTLRYATGYTVTHRSDYVMIEVDDPWHSGQLLHRYLLVARDQPLPTALPAGTVVKVPIRNLVVYNTVHSSALEQLGVADRIIGMCESRYVKNPALLERIKEGKMVDLGESTMPNVEKMLEIGTEVVMASPFQNAGYGAVEKLGIPIIECPDYMETTPLGRTEWLHFLGLFIGKTATADSLFAETEHRYLAIKAEASAQPTRPTILSGKRYGNTWYVPAGESYMARFFEDAAADYLFKEEKGAGSIPLTFESVLDRAIHADYWIFNYNEENSLTRADLRAEYRPYENFDAFKKEQVYGCNTHWARYYEDIMIHPDLILDDFFAIFHPSARKNHQFRYFQPLK